MSRRELLRGVRFGLLLQLAVGPVCLFVLRTGSEHGAGPGLLAVLGVALVDALYVALALLGVTRWAENGQMRRFFRYAGAAVVGLFGLDIIAAAAGVPLLPPLSLAGHFGSSTSVLVSALVLTASNPLTILFWAGVFSAKVAAERYGRSALWSFSLGCVSATIGFLTAIVLAGAVLGRALPARALSLLNMGVGLALLCYGVRLALRQEERASER